MRTTNLGIVLFVTACLTATWPEAAGVLEARTGQPPVVHATPRSDGRVATVIDRQGTALVRPVGRERWTPLRQRDLLMPGDLVRTSVRGANALEARFVGGGRMVVGPGTLVECTGPRAVRIYRGEVSVEPESTAGAAPLRLVGPGGYDRPLAKATVARVQGAATAELEQPPRWLTGYRESTTDEWVGSLIAKVDGRDVPMSVGYHKVDAVIRDQIAQTTVEQSFINSTKERLEGVFYFPLPADASISGFGMWIGGELVEADIVEKQRARQIYEDILRRKKDPGLLEWSGGNLFKARVFPIEPHSEKRIRIRYTQVLPMEGATVRYRYALRSELLRKRPLRSLDIKVSVSSAMPITAAASSTHEVRVRHTEHAATLEFDAQEYTPEKDFEAAITLDRSDPLTVVPHRRGDDGYFMMLLTPPDGAAGKWRRELLPEGDPVDLIVVADTSASMDPAARQAQADFVRALLSMLGKQDRFRLMTADIEVQNFAADPVSVSEESIKGAMAFLARRDSLGWTDLDRVMARIDAEAREGSVVVYVGDGIGTTGDADPVALARRIRMLGRDCKGVVHAVSLGSTYEQGVLDALASLGGGSVRSVGEDAASAAFELLAEAAQPAVKDLQVAFEGLRTARVYPEVPANLPVGKQQVVLGRFLPTGQDQQGRAIVTGTLRGKPVRFTAPVTIEAGETGNSFIPRLWARRHLDHLLAQGSSKEVQDDIVAFSTEFGIMTPYTSFLVLENDEDRKRYGVERRVRMRDGEKFFAKGRDDAATEVLRQQMRVARTYRLQLRLRMMQEIEGLGRQLHGWAAAVSHTVERHANGLLGDSRGRRYGWGPGAPAADGAMEGRFKAGADRALEVSETADDGDDFFAGEQANRGVEVLDKFVDNLDSPEELLTAGKKLPAASPAPVSGGRSGFLAREDLKRRRSYRPRPPQPPSYDFSYFGFPALAGPTTEPTKVRRADWPKAILDLLGSLDRRARVAAADVGFLLTVEVDNLHELQGRLTGWSRTVGSYVAGEWARTDTGPARQPMHNWVHGGQRGILADALALGRQRAANAVDGGFAFPLLDYSTRDFARQYVDYTAAMTPLEGDLVRVELRDRKPSTYRMEFVIDRARRVVTRMSTHREGKRLTSTTMSDFVEQGGMYWASKIEHRNAKDRLVWRRALSIETGAKAAVAARVQAVAAAARQAIMIGHRDPELAAARQAIHVGKAGVPELLRIVTHYGATQQWDEAWAAWGKVVAAVGANRAVPLLRLKLQSASRRGEEFKAGLGEIVGRWPALVASPATTPAGIDFLADHLRQLAGQVLSTTEQLTLLESLEPVLRRPAGEKPDPRELADRRQRDIAYRSARIGYLNSLGRVDEVLRLRQQLAASYADEYGVVMAYVQALGSASDRAGQVRALTGILARKATWLEPEVGQFFQSWADALYHLRDLAGLVRVADQWMERLPEDAQGYHVWLASSMFRNRSAEVAAWVRAELGKELAAAVPDAVQLARLRAAARQAMGQGWNMSNNSVDDAAATSLAGLVRRCAKAGGQQYLQLANEIVSSWYFRRTDAFAALRKEFLTDLLADEGIATMALDRLAVYMRWIEWGRNRIDREDWAKARDQLMARFAAAPDVGTQRTLATHVLQVLDAWQESAAAVAFLRDWLKVAKDTPEAVAHMLIDRLLGRDWTVAIEDEVIGLVERLKPAVVEADQWETIAAEAIRKLSDGLLAARVKATLGKVEELEKLPRNERREREQRARQTMRQQLAARLGKAADEVDDYYRHWYRIEQLCLAAEAGADRSGSVAAARKVLAAVPGTGADDEPVARGVLRERSALVMAYAATRRDARPEVGDQVLKIYREQLASNAKTLDWRYQLFRLMVALERGDELAQQLRAWIVPEKADSTWRRSLGYLLAERGKVEEAVKVFEGVASVDDLRPADYTALANWYLVLGDRGRREEAMLRRWQVSSEGELSSVLYAAARKVSQRGGGLPGALASDDLLAIRTLLAKTAQPANYMWRVQNIYHQGKDHRILGCLPYGVVGHTSGSIYAFLTRTAQTIAQVHEEATCDSLTESIRSIAAQTERAVDKRGLLLMVAQVERRAAEVLNAAGDHVAGALAAMRQSFKGDWDRGERAEMAKYLASLGRIRQQPLADEQLRQLRELHAAAPDASHELLTVAGEYARTLWAYGRRDDAVETLTSALQQTRTGAGAVLPRSANNTVATLLNYLRTRRHFQQGERFLTAEIARQTWQSQRNWYTQQLDALYIDCLRHHGEVGIGRGEQLYARHREQLLARMWEGATDVMEPAFRNFLSLHTTAVKAGIGRARTDLQAFIAKTLPEFGARFLLDRGNRISQVASTAKEAVGAGLALQTLVAALEREPDWLRTVNREYWRSFAWSIARFRQEARDRALEQRLLPIALRELRSDLERRDWRNTSLFHKSNRYFWYGASSDFAKVTGKFIDDHSGSVASVMFAANYLWGGLAQRETAIAALERLHSTKRLPESGRWQLARWYKDVREYAQAIPLLRALMAEREDRLDYRIQLIEVLFASGAVADANALLTATASRWQEKKWWNEGSMAQLAKVALENEVWKQAAQWYEEAVRANERGGSRHWNWRSTRSTYYGFMARAHSKLGNTAQAVDAASAAVVTWGNDQRNRKSALAALHRVVRGIPDLDGYVAQWDAKVGETGLDAPLIRKYVGRVYLDNGEATRAIAQLRIARELQPNDDEVHQLLVMAHDSKHDKAGAIEALKASVRMSPMNLDLYAQLAQRLAEAEDPGGAERAYTSMVEVQPNEAESHRRLAKIRDNQRRFKDAVVQWRQVVRVRSLEPDGWLGLANSQIQAADFEGARKSIDHVLNTKWEERFKDAKARARGLQRLLESRRG